MQTFLLTVLAIYYKYPKATCSQIAHNFGVPTTMVRQARNEIAARNFIVRENNTSWYVTFLGKTALSLFDVEKAKENTEVIKHATEIICKVLNTSPDELGSFTLMDKGMTNDSYMFYCGGKRYIYRRAGEGSEQLVDRYREYSNYLALQGRGISDVVVYHNPVDGTKISEFIEDSKGIDVNNREHMKQALIALRNLHNADIVSPHSFEFIKMIDYYEEICHNKEVEFYSTYRKYKARVEHLLSLIEKMKVKRCFCHIDFVPGNCLLDKNGRVVLIDWEYSGEQDPLVDIAMFCISSSFSKAQADKLLQDYLLRKPTLGEFARLYTYIATGGLMWSLWSEYKTASGEVFQGYTDRVYKLCVKYTDQAQHIFDRIDKLK